MAQLLAGSLAVGVLIVRRFNFVAYVNFSQCVTVTTNSEFRRNDVSSGQPERSTSGIS